MTETPFGFDGAFLQRLERLALLSRRPLAGDAGGPRRSPRHGQSVEFADFRDYAPGDDVRRIDWSAYARLDRLFLRLYRAEETTTLTLLIDRSRSMETGDPPKSLTAARIAAIFSFIALNRYDRVAVAGWGDSIDRFLPVQSGRHAIPLVWKHIEGIQTDPASATDFGALKELARYRRGAGIAIVLSDFLTDSDWRTGLRALRALRQETTVIQILAPEELQPDIRGDWRLRDAETGREVEVTISPRLLRRYLEELEAHTGEIRDQCRKLGITFLQIPSDAPVLDVVTRHMRAAGVVG